MEKAPFKVGQRASNKISEIKFVNEEYSNLSLKKKYYKMLDLY